MMSGKVSLLKSATARPKARVRPATLPSCAWSKLGCSAWPGEVAVATHNSTGPAKIVKRERPFAGRGILSVWPA
jgi:hypothetical protein